MLHQKMLDLMLAFHLRHAIYKKVKKSIIFAATCQSTKNLNYIIVITWKTALMQEDESEWFAHRLVSSPFLVTWSRRPAVSSTTFLCSLLSFKLLTSTSELLWSAIMTTLLASHPKISDKNSGTVYTSNSSTYIGKKSIIVKTVQFYPDLQNNSQHLLTIPL